MTEMLKQLYNIIAFSLGRFRAVFWRIFVKHMGRNNIIMESCMIMAPAGISIGNNSGISHHTVVSGIYPVSIGHYVMIGPHCIINSANHRYDLSDKPMKSQGTVGGPIVIEDDVWLGANVVILPNVVIGRGSIVGAGSVVTKNVEPYSIVGGVPAKHIKYRFPQEIIQKAKKIDWENYND